MHKRKNFTIRAPGRFIVVCFISPKSAESKLQAAEPLSNLGELL